MAHKITLFIIAISFILGGCAVSPKKLQADHRAEAKEQTQKSEESIEEVLKAARFAEEKGDDIAASAYYGTVLEILPFHKKALLGFAQSARKSGLSDKTFPHLETYLRKYPQDAQIQFEYAKNLALGQRYEQALEALEVAAKENPQEWHYVSLKAVIYDRLERYDISETIYQQALGKFPNNPILRNNYALSLLMNNKNIQAEQEAEKMMQVPKLSSEMVGNYARILFSNGKQNKAEQIVRAKLLPLEADRILMTLRQEFIQPQRWGKV